MKLMVVVAVVALPSFSMGRQRLFDAFDPLFPTGLSDSQFSRRGYARSGNNSCDDLTR